MYWGLSLEHSKLASNWSEFDSRLPHENIIFQLLKCVENRVVNSMAGELTTGTCLYLLSFERRRSLVLRSPDPDPPWIAFRSSSNANALTIHVQILIRIKRVMMRKRCCGSRMFFIESGFGLVFDVNFGSSVLFQSKVVAQRHLYLLFKTLNASNLLGEKTYFGSGSKC
jgi:hypothetical protein